MANGYAVSWNPDDDVFKVTLEGQGAPVLVEPTQMKSLAESLAGVRPFGPIGGTVRMMVVAGWYAKATAGTMSVVLGYPHESGGVLEFTDGHGQRQAANLINTLLEARSRLQAHEWTVHEMLSFLAISDQGLGARFVQEGIL